MKISENSPESRNSRLIPELSESKPKAEELRRAQKAMIMSVSGWRKVFASHEEDAGENIRPADTVLAGIIGLSLADFLTRTLKKAPEEICLVVGCDSRPTGDLIAQAFMRTLISRRLKIRYLSISAAPEIISYSALCEELDAFAYISASHNPIGHNGFKFGLSPGGVLPAHLLDKLEDVFFKYLEGSQDLAYSILTTASSKRMEEIFQSREKYKAQALDSYQESSEKILAGGRGTDTLGAIRSALRERTIGILGELNGSARALSIDRRFFEGLGARITLINDRPGQIVHRIVPEGRSLNLCRSELEKAHKKDDSYLLGYVPDNDGDRGNIVHIAANGRADILDSQTLFALVALAESAWLEYNGELAQEDGGRGAAIVINGPTSMRIDEIARAFGMDCFRSEVGEANVIALAERLRKEGRLIRLMGEGSNGGCIIHPAVVRDPLNSIASIIKLLTIREGARGPGLFQICCERLDRDYSPDFTLDDVLDALPAYTSTSATEDLSIMKIRSKDHKRLKAVWEDIFLQDWEKRRAELADRWGLESWLEINTEGTMEKIGFGPEYRSGAERGGLKILFSDSSGEAQAHIWMRGSKTEPVFRILADVRGARPQLETYLIQWQRSMIERADALADLSRPR